MCSDNNSKCCFFLVECVHIQEILAEGCDNWIINTSNITDPIRYTKYSVPETRGDSSGQDKTTVYRDIPQVGQYQHSEAIQVSMKVRRAWTWSFVPGGVSGISIKDSVLYVHAG